jgi:biotin carboxyl carrier protein
VRHALKQEDALQAPTVGTWRPALGLGAPVSEGVVLGRLIRLGRPLEVVAPSGVAGVVVELRASGAWVGCGDLLVRWGTGGLAGSLGAPVEAAGAELVPGAKPVRAETDGTVYTVPEPGKPPFAGEGTAVSQHQTLALVEVMKTFTPVRSPFAGVVARVDVSNGQAVREGDTLLWIRPA